MTHPTAKSPFAEIATSGELPVGLTTNSGSSVGAAATADEAQAPASTSAPTRSLQALITFAIVSPIRSRGPPASFWTLRAAEKHLLRARRRPKQVKCEAWSAELPAQRNRSAARSTRCAPHAELRFLEQVGAERARAVARASGLGSSFGRPLDSPTPPSGQARAPAGCAGTRAAGGGLAGLKRRLLGVPDQRP